MSTTYRLKGRRHLRMYTAPNLTPSTAAGSDVAAISDRFCEVPWTAAPLDAYPCFPTYAAAKVDENAGSRACFDAAEWCAEHDAAKRHRAYAQAAIYRFALPPEARAVTLESVAVTVTCDPYTPQGARVAAMLTDADDLPTECALVRTMDAHAEGVAPRTAVTNAGTGAVTWYETTATADLAIGSSGRKWLLVFIGLEDYRARNGWLEGAAMIGGVSATFSAPVPGWSETAPVDLRFDGASTVALEGGSSPTWLQPLNMLAGAGNETVVLESTPVIVRYDSSRNIYYFKFSVNMGKGGVIADIDLHVNSAKRASGASNLVESPPVNFTYSSKAGTSSNYKISKIANVYTTRDVTVNGTFVPNGSIVFSFSKAITVSSGGGVTIRDSFECLVHPVIRDGHVMLLAFSPSSMASEENEVGEMPYSPVDMGEVPHPFTSDVTDASESVRAGTSSDEALGDMSWQIATMDVETGSRTPGDTFRHILSLSREVGDGVAHDYAFAAQSFPLSDMDRVTVVPRFARAATVPAGQAAISQPGLSIWYHKKNDGVSFVQGSLLVLRATSDGTTLRLTALAPVANTGVAIRLAVWRSSGVAWEGSAGFHTAQQLVKAVGFVDASEASVTAPGHQFTDGDFAGLPPIGGVTADRIGMSSEISGALSSGDQIEIRLDPAVSTGDVLIIAPVPVGLSPTASGNDAHFGRQSDPSAETTKSWCRYTANLGWFPKIEVM